MSDWYIHRRYQTQINNLHLRIAQLQAQLPNTQIKTISSNTPYIITYNHYFSLWCKGNNYKIKITKNQHTQRLNYIDTYGWQLIDEYLQLSYFDLDNIIVIYLD